MERERERESWKRLEDEIRTEASCPAGQNDEGATKARRMAPKESSTCREEGRDELHYYNISLYYIYYI